MNLRAPVTDLEPVAWPAAGELRAWLGPCGIRIFTPAGLPARSTATETPT